MVSLLLVKYVTVIVKSSQAGLVRMHKDRCIFRRDLWTPNRNLFVRDCQIKRLIKLIVNIFTNIIPDFYFRSNVEEATRPIYNSCAISIKHASRARAEGHEREHSTKRRRKIINYCLLKFLEARRARRQLAFITADNLAGIPVNFSSKRLAERMNRVLSCENAP